MQNTVTPKMQYNDLSSKRGFSWNPTVPQKLWCNHTTWLGQLFLMTASSAFDRKLIKSTQQKISLSYLNLLGRSTENNNFIKSISVLRRTTEETDRGVMAKLEIESNRLSQGEHGNALRKAEWNSPLSWQYSVYILVAEANKAASSVHLMKDDLIRPWISPMRPSVDPAFPVQ